MDEVRDAPDEQLISLSKDGSLEAFNSLVERHQSLVYNLCYRLLGERQAAEDATQEAFLSAYRALASFAGGNVRSWLLRIAANESKDELRRRKRKDAGSLDQIFDRAEAPLEVPDPSAGTETLYERKELSMGLQQALLALPMDQRQVIVLCDLQGYRYEEIAEMTGASVGTVKSRIHRGRERLRQVIGERPELFGRQPRLEG